MANQRPNPNEAFPNPKIPSLCYIKNVVKNPRIIIGDYTYYDDVDGADQFEKHVTHFYDFIGDKLIIGKFCAIAKGVEFVMNGANHRMDCATTYPFYIMGGDWGSSEQILWWQRTFRLIPLLLVIPVESSGNALMTN